LEHEAKVKVDELADKVDLRGLILVVVISFCIGLVSGFVENPPEASVIGHKYYGWPLVWRIIRMFLGEEYLYFELFVDLLFWFLIVAIVYVVVKKLVKV